MCALLVFVVVHPVFKGLQQQRSFASSSSSSSSSNFPESTVYGGPIANPVDGGGGAAPRVTVRTVAAKYKKHEKLVMMTAYDYPSARLCDATPDIDMVLVGDSVAMVVHGHDTTLPITLDEMIVHSRAVVRGAKRPLIIGDLPFGSFETTPSDAVRAAVRMLKEGNVDAVKIEGSSDARLAAVSAISDAGIAVMGHVGLTPQSISAIGGFRPTGRTAEEAISVLDGAKRLQDAGCFAVVLECVPASVARAVTERLSIPTIGIGAGVHTSGQVLVFHDLLGIAQHPHHATVTPRFCKQYAQAGIVIAEGLAQYASEVKQAEFPSDKYSPYKMGDGAMDEFQKLLAERGE
ncbi:hypothetical protein PPROV_000929600 [Pycnococcus provasolii]|uniref:3-methyl-2-oxobutanoate hydroxymethyltransferase n=2 Tax=Pycnococcus provasolii TaxID=41880 RepID=A0A830HV23_9CHLO|nr:hypothetical protein PPROV_000929600 [Pycnococcus provasolii]